MKKLISKLLNGEGKISMLLLEAREYASKANDTNLLGFIDNELNGYLHENIPEYRKAYAEIVVTIMNSYGQIIQNEFPLNFSAVSDKIGIDLNTVYFPDGIAFIESAYEGLSGQFAIKPIPQPLVNMLNEVFKNNNPAFTLTAAGHRFGKAIILYILTKVRQDLIIGLQRIELTSSEIGTYSIRDIAESKPLIRVFVTYAWESEKQNDLVISFVDFLRKNGYDATMDRKVSQEESSINFNKMMIEGIQNSDKVIIILSKKYKEKAESFKGGVSMEFQMILEEIKTQINKFIFVSFGDKLDDITPTGIKAREILDLKREQDDNKYNGLFAKLQSKDTIPFSNVNVELPEVILKEIKPFIL